MLFRSPGLVKNDVDPQVKIALTLTCQDSECEVEEVMHWLRIKGCIAMFISLHLKNCNN